MIETSTKMKFAPFNSSYPGHRDAMLAANLDPAVNKWNAVFDFNDRDETQENWRLLLPEERDPLWSPLDDANADQTQKTDDKTSLVQNETTKSEKTSVGQNNDDIEEIVDDEEEDDESISHPCDSLHNIRVFGCRAWSFITDTVFSIQAFCLGLIFGGLQTPNKMISKK